MKTFKNLTPKTCTISECSKDAAELITKVFREVTAAETKHPDFCKNLPDALLVIGEELGEAQRAYLQYEYEGKNYEEVRKELIQTGAMIFRTLLNFDEFVEDISLARITAAAFSDVATKAAEIKTPAPVPSAYDFQSQLYAMLTGNKRPELFGTDWAAEMSDDAAHSIAEDIFKKSFPGCSYNYGCDCTDCREAFNQAKEQIAAAKENELREALSKQPTVTFSSNHAITADDIRKAQAKRNSGNDVFSSIFEGIGRVTSSAPIYQQQAGRGARSWGKSYSFINYLANTPGVYGIISMNETIEMQVRKNRIKFSLLQTVEQKKANPQYLQTFCKLNAPIGFKISHTRFTDDKVVVVCKRS